MSHDALTDDTLQQLAREGFADPRKLFTPDGRLRHLEDLDEDTAAAIENIETFTRPAPGGVEYVHRITFADKTKALETLGQSLKDWRPVGPT